MTNKIFRTNFVSDSFEDIYINVLEELQKDYEFKVVARGEEMLEIINLGFVLTNPLNRFIWNGERKVNYEFAMRFFIWMVNGCEDFEYVLGVNPNARKYTQADADETGNAKPFSTAYGPRIMRQLPHVIDELRRDPGTRRAVISIRLEEDLKMLGTNSDQEFPCTNSLHFFLRDDQLHLHVSMRSNNMATTVVYDVFNFTMIQEYVLNLLNSKGCCYRMGNYYHNCASAHYFTGQAELVKKVLAASKFGSPQPIMIRPEVKQ